MFKSKYQSGKPKISPEFWSLIKDGNLVIFSAFDFNSEIIELDGSGPFLYQTLEKSTDMKAFFNEVNQTFDAPLKDQDIQYIDEFLDRLIELGVLEIR